MDPNANLADIRQLITQAKNEEAAERLLAYLNEADEPVRSWRDTVSNLLAQYKRVRLQQQRNTVSFDEASRTINKITDGLLASLAGIEEGLPAPAPKATEVTESKTPPWLVIGVVVALVLATASFFMLRGFFQGDAPVEAQQIEVEQGESEEGKCPPYEVDSDFNIMVLPFQPLDGKIYPVENSLRIRLANKMEEYGITGSIFTQKIDPLSDEYPLTSNQAASLGKPCQAQLIIWGTTENVDDEEDIVTTKFRFIDSEHFSLTNLEFTDDVTIDTISSLSSIASSAEVTERIEKTIRLLLGLVAHETEHYDVAAEALEEVIEERGGVADNPKWGMIQADSYIKSGQDERAIEVYREMLKTDSTNVQAWLQLGHLEYRAGRTTAANVNLTKVLEYDPNNTKARTARAAVSVKRNDLYQAREDLDVLEQNPERQIAVREIRKDYEVKYQAEEEKLKTAEKQLEDNPKDTAAWRVKAQTAQNLGQFQSAEKAASNLLEIDPLNVSAIQTLQWVMKKVPDSIAVRNKLEKTIPRLSPEQKLRVRPLIIPQ